MCFPLSTFFLGVATSPHTPASESLPLVLTIPAVKDGHCHFQTKKQRLKGFMWFAPGNEVRELKTQRFEARLTGYGQRAETRSKRSVPCSIFVFFGAQHHPHAAQWASFFKSS